MKTNTTISKTFFIVCSFFFFLNASAQAPARMTYQAVIRNASNALVANANVGIQISILQTSVTAAAVFVERHTVTTNINGLATIEIGGGALVSGNFSTIDWANGPYFIKTETDPTGGTNYTIFGTSQLLSVPFALFAANSGSSSNSWGINGNAITTANFIGTTNDNDVIFKRNGIAAGRISDNRFGENGTTAFGIFALSSNTEGIANTAIGSNTLKDNTRGSFNVAVGSDALQQNTTGTSNTAIGSNSLTENTTGSSNTALGSFALNENTTGSDNTAIGTGALFINNTGAGNTATGADALRFNRDGLSNTANGHRALSRNTSGNSNTAIGSSALTLNTGGDFNTAIGVDALFSNTFGSNNTASGAFALNRNDRGVNNSAHGREALFSNTGGNRNTANGRGALFTNTTGNDNTASGESALFGNTTGINNTATGKDALLQNTTGNNNTASGFQALLANTTGINNTANGILALDTNTTGNDNTAMGRSALTDNIIGVSNTAIGKDALFNSLGNNNTALGRGTLSGVTTGSNNTAIGFDAQVPSASNNNQVRLGNTAVTLVSAQVALTVTSDLRWKSNIQKSNLGLDFIKQLNPVFYTRKDVSVTDGKSVVSETTSNPTTEYGFIAQEMKNTLAKFETTNNGIITKDDDGMYGVRYNDLIAPIVKAMQEQQTIIDAQAKTIDAILKKLKTLENKK